VGINFFELDVNVKIKKKNKIKKWIKDIIGKHNKICDNINIILVNDNHLLKLNMDYLNRNYLTDIITFNFNKKDKISGDLYISADRIKENSTTHKISSSNELLRVIIHGILHLMEYNDNNKINRKIMKEAENTALKDVRDIIII